jgi:Ca2+-binding RTX toxin-like protein
VDGENGNDILVAEPVSDSYVLAVTPTQIVLTDASAENTATINYSQVEHLVIVGTADTMYPGQAIWTTGDTIDELTVMGTRGEIPIGISSGGGDDKIYLNGLVGNGSHVIAGGGNDIVRGSSRDDVLEGGDGDDILTGGGGWDILYGGSGSDTFRFDTMQGAAAGVFLGWIEDFERQFDKIDLSGIDADTTTPGNQAFHLIGTQFTGTAGELRGTSFAIQADRDGDTVPDMIIHMPYPYGGLGLNAAHFVL